MGYNENKLCLTNRELAESFGEALINSNYRFLYNAIMGGIAPIDNWTNEYRTLELIKTLSDDDQIIIKFLLLCYPQKVESISRIFGSKGLEFLIKSGIAKIHEDYLNPTGYAVIPVNKLYLIVSLPCVYSKSQSKFSDIYIGQDSMRLAQMVSSKKFEKILDLCAGSGFQGMNTLSSSSQVDAVELNHNAYISIKLNQMINFIQDNQYYVSEGDLYEPIQSEKQYDCILSNPPYVPTPDCIELPMCGAGGEDGMKIARKIIDGYDNHLKSNGHAYMVLECIGDDNEPYILNYFKEKMNKGIVNVSLLNRQSIEFQSGASASMTVEFYDDPENFDYYESLWSEMFKQYSATSIYPVVIEYIKCDKPLTINIVHNYMRWNAHSRFTISTEISKKQKNVEYYDLENKGEKLACVKKDFYDIIYNNQDKTAYEIAKLMCNQADSFLNTLSDCIRLLAELDYNNILERR